MTGSSPPQKFSDALGRALRSELYLQRMERCEKLSKKDKAEDRGKELAHERRDKKKKQLVREEERQRDQSQFQLPECARCKRRHLGECLTSHDMCFRCH